MYTVFTFSTKFLVEILESESLAQATDHLHKYVFKILLNQI